MLRSVRALLEGIIDYAGLFPPAKLELPHALHSYVENLSGPDAWMLGRFVCPVGQVTEAARLLRGMNRATRRPSFSLLPRQAINPNDSARSLREEAKTLAESRLADLGAAGDVWEIRLEPDAAGEGRSADLRRLLEAVEEALAPAGPEIIYYEAAAASPGSLLRRLGAPGVASVRNRIGFKLRTGGLEAKAFPSPEQVVEVLVAGRDTGLPMKFTAGLHHPVRRFDPHLGSYAYGFFNVFGAALLAHAHSLDAEALRRILLEEDPAAFIFREIEFGWKDYRIGADAVSELRKNKVISFGSCSFDEPRDDLRALGLLP
jgi:hypothetical protein